jgi:S1/P1 Nuclease
LAAATAWKRQKRKQRSDVVGSFNIEKPDHAHICVSSELHTIFEFLPPSICTHARLDEIRSHQFLLVPYLVNPPGAVAWGRLGHQTVAWIAQSLISEDTAPYVKAVLESNASDYMPNISTWADTYRYTDDGGWSVPLHYIDANDSPPGECDVQFNRDCAESGCVVSATVNYTKIVMDESLPHDERRDAMRFLTHFAGDIHQPLHVENLEAGGNGIEVTFGDEDTNLHHIWDTEIPEKLAGGLKSEEWAQKITQAITSDDFGDATAWTTNISAEDAEGTALSWASDANDYVCTDVLLDGVDAVETGDLSGAYFDAHGELARLQIAKAGYRLTKYLDLVAGSSS